MTETSNVLERLFHVLDVNTVVFRESVEQMVQTISKDMSCSPMRSDDVLLQRYGRGLILKLQEAQRTNVWLTVPKWMIHQYQERSKSLAKEELARELEQTYERLLKLLPTGSVEEIFWKNSQKNSCGTMEETLSLESMPNAETLKRKFTGSGVEQDLGNLDGPITNFQMHIGKAQSTSGGMAMIQDITIPSSLTISEEISQPLLNYLGCSTDIPTALSVNLEPSNFPPPLSSSLLNSHRKSHGTAKAVRTLDSCPEGSKMSCSLKKTAKPVKAKKYTLENELKVECVSKNALRAKELKTASENVQKSESPILIPTENIDEDFENLVCDLFDNESDWTRWDRWPNF